MNNQTNFSVASVAAVACLWLLGNVAYFIAYGHGGSAPECGIWCVIFFNIAVACQFLPLLSGSVSRSGYLVRGQGVLAGIYFALEALVAVTLLAADAGPRVTIILQLLLLLGFLFAFFINEASNRRTDSGLRKMAAQASPSLVEARAILTSALAVASIPEEREALRSALADISAVPMATRPETDGLESMILEAAQALVANPSADLSRKMSRLIARRTAMIISLSQY